MPTYTVIIDRDGAEDAPDHHDGTADGAIAQLARELQEAWDLAGVGGFFTITSREA